MNKKKVQTRTLTYGNKCTTQMKEKNLTTLFTELTSDSDWTLMWKLVNDIQKIYNSAICKMFIKKTHGPVLVTLQWYKIESTKFNW